MNNQLNSISTQYRKFSKGQYVKHTQFNEFLDFFEDQDRLSRVMLHGVGIVCGFDPELTYTNKRVTGISLSQGIAITTDGDLLTLNNKIKTKKSDDLYVSELKTIDFVGNQYTHFKPYDNHKVVYPAFYESNNQIELYELATSENATGGFEPLINLGNFEGRYLLLYLENYEKEIKPCRGVDCDNHGVQQIQNLKVLVTTASGISKILKEDKVSPHPLFSNLTADKKLKRVILTPVKESPDSLRQAYYNVLTESDYASMFHDLDVISNIMKIPLVAKDGFVETINNLANQSGNFQYAYSVLKDLTDTYAEISGLIPKAFTKSLPDLKSFPKHILLGKLIPNTKFDGTRHKFYNSPVVDSDKVLQRLKVLIDRFNIQAIEFKDPSEVESIKITPSQYISPLGNKAIPFYYNLTENLVDVWEFDKTINRASNANLSFDTSLLSEALHIQNPTDYNIDKKSFYRIEGHQGVHYRDAVNDIRKIKEEKQLGFDVMALSLEQIGDNKDVSKVYFSDYVKKHPGLEYLGGVKRGGTFAVVYQSETNPVVIADFALPYICCTPKSDVALSLPVTTTCISASPLIFTITPPNGVVKADVDGELIGGVEIVKGQYRFNTERVEEELIDKEIRFTVNGKPTNCTIKVLSNLDLDIYASNFVYPSSASSYTTVTFRIANQNAADYDYEWDFLDDGNYIPLQPDSQGRVKYDYLKIDSAKPVKVLITASGCSQNKILTDWYVPQQVVNVAPSIVDIRNDMAGNLYAPNAEAKLYSTVVKGSGTVNDYLWTCTDSSVVFTSANLSSTGVTFPSAGTYTISLTIKDSNNLQDTDFITVVVGAKARISTLVINPQNPTTLDNVMASAIVLNPSAIGGLKYSWYLDGEFQEQTTSNIRSFGTLGEGVRKIEVALSESTGGNHLSDVHSVTVTVARRTTIGTSFLAGTLITMADGSKKTVEQIKKDDILKSLDGTVKVIDAINYISDSDVYRLNEDKYFITGTHPVFTDRGWTSFEPEKTNMIISSIRVTQLVAKDILIKEKGERVPLSNTEKIAGSNRVYNLEVDGTKDFFANGYRVYSEIESLNE